VSGAQPLRLMLSSSAPLAATIAIVHAAAAACILLVLPGWTGIALAVLALLLGAAAAADRALFLGARAPRSLEIGIEGSAKLICVDGSTAPLVALGGIGVTRWWVALRITSGQRRSLFVPVGMLTPEALRILRVWALWGKLPGSGRAGVAQPQLPA
jgi:hypothetical protein